MRKCFAAAAVAATSWSAAHAQIETVTLDFPATAGRELLFWGFGGGGYEGWEIVSVRVYLEYTAEDGLDAAEFVSHLDVPVLDPLGGTEAMFILGADLGWSGVGTFTYTDETDAFNGIIRSGRFGWELEGGGLITEGSRIEFDVRQVPAPSAAGVLAAGGLLAMRRRR